MIIDFVNNKKWIIKGAHQPDRYNDLKIVRKSEITINQSVGSHFLTGKLIGIGIARMKRLLIFE